MKLLVISDTLDAEKSVIPYALRLARRMNIQVKVLHIVDPRLVKGIYSAYSDSQTVSASAVETAEETLKKEMGSADLFLNTLLSRETSVLNFPLRVDYQVVEDSIDQRLIKESKNRDNEIILIASQPDGRFWQDYRDITYVANRLHCPVVLAPRQVTYQHPEKIRIFRLADWTETGQLNKVLCFIGELGISSEVIGQIGPIQKFDPKIPSDVEMLVVMQNRLVFLKRLFSMRLSKILSKNQQIPILLYNFKARKKPKALTA